ncbi:MAG: tRNA pseudouridine(55) synthase TruB [Fibrobacterota bacterium]
MNSGILSLDKPAGISSHTALNAVKRIVGKRLKVGHAGTLDPMATGVLAVGIGPATKVLSYIQKHEKTYRCSIKLGLETDTYDTTGRTVSEKAADISEEELKKIIKSFTGKIMQRPPAFSAVNVKGAKAYKIARKGEKVDLVKRPVFIREIREIKIEGDTAEFTVVCGPGTYIRSLAYDIGRKAGCGACVSALSRTRSGSLKKETSVRPEDLNSMDDVLKALIPIYELLPEFGKVLAPPALGDMVRNGMVLPEKDIQIKKRPDPVTDIYILCGTGGIPLALTREDSYKGIKGFRPFRYLGKNEKN